MTLQFLKIVLLINERSCFIVCITSDSRLQQEHFLYGDRDAFQAILDQVEWTDEASARLEGLIGSNATIYCTNSNDRVCSCLQYNHTHLSHMHVQGSI